MRAKAELDDASALPGRHVFHMVDEANWPSVAARGLLTATALLHEAHPGDQACALARTHRPQTLVLPSGQRLRDQSPMPPAALALCLEAPLTPPDWYELLNGHVFFWSDAERLNRHRMACAEHAQHVLVVDAGALLQRYAPQARVTAFNTGYALRRATTRGVRSFVPYERWRQYRWADEAAPGQKPRAASHPVVELAVAASLPDILACTVDVVALRAGELLALPAGR